MVMRMPLRADHVLLEVRRRIGQGKWSFDVLCMAPHTSPGRTHQTRDLLAYPQATPSVI